MDDIEKSLPEGCPVLGYTTEMIGYGEAAENSLPVWMHEGPNARRAAKKGEYEAITENFLGRFESVVKVRKAAF